LKIENADGIPQLQMGEEGKNCPLYDETNRLCNIYHSMPVNCRAFPLAFSGEKFFVSDRSCEGIGRGQMTREQLEADREAAQNCFQETQLTQMVVPVFQILLLRQISEEQKKTMESLTEEQRSQLEEILKSAKEPEQEVPPADTSE
jgi:Fe-S-cluster containining protein